MNRPVDRTIIPASKSDFLLENDSDPNFVHILRYTGKNKFIKIPDVINDKKVLSIRKRAFHNTQVKIVDLPSTLEVIESTAFELSQLNEIEIPESVHFIGDRAFVDCEDLKKIKFQDGCNVLKRNYIPEAREKEVDRILCFYYDIIDYNRIKNGIIFGKEIFLNCKKLNNVYLSNIRVSYISEGMFKYCNKLNKIDIPSSVYYIFREGFYMSGIGTINFSENITDIEEYAFYGCLHINSLKLPTKLITIKNHAFADCTHLFSVKMNDGLELIDEYAFYNTKIPKINIPASTMNIAITAFQGCDRLEHIYINPKSNYYKSVGKVLYFNYENKYYEAFRLP